MQKGKKSIFFYHFILFENGMWLRQFRMLYLVSEGHWLKSCCCYPSIFCNRLSSSGSWWGPLPVYLLKKCKYLPRVSLFQAAHCGQAGKPSQATCSHSLIHAHQLVYLCIFGLQQETGEPSSEETLHDSGGTWKCTYSMEWGAYLNGLYMQGYNFGLSIGQLWWLVFAGFEYWWGRGVGYNLPTPIIYTQVCITTDGFEV